MYIEHPRESGRPSRPSATLCVHPSRCVSDIGFTHLTAITAIVTLKAPVLSLYPTQRQTIPQNSGGGKRIEGIVRTPGTFATIRQVCC